MALADELLRGGEVWIETSLTPPIRVELDGAASGETSPLVSFLKPKVTVRRSGVALFSVAPAGEPGEGFPVALALAGIGALLLLLFSSLRR